MNATSDMPGPGFSELPPTEIFLYEKQQQLEDIDENVDGPLIMNKVQLHRSEQVIENSFLPEAMSAQSTISEPDMPNGPRLSDAKTRKFTFEGLTPVSSSVTDTRDVPETPIVRNSVSPGSRESEPMKGDTVTSGDNLDMNDGNDIEMDLIDENDTEPDLKDGTDTEPDLKDGNDTDMDANDEIDTEIQVMDNTRSDNSHEDMERPTTNLNDMNEVRYFIRDNTTRSSIDDESFVAKTTLTSSHDLNETIEVDNKGVISVILIDDEHNTSELLEVAPATPHYKANILWHFCGTEDVPFDEEPMKPKPLAASVAHKLAFYEYVDIKTPSKKSYLDDIEEDCFNSKQGSNHTTSRPIETKPLIAFDTAKWKDCYFSYDDHSTYRPKYVDDESWSIAPSDELVDEQTLLMSQMSLTNEASNDCATPFCRNLRFLNFCSN